MAELRIVLVGCSKLKVEIPSHDWVAARELYRSPLFVKRREFVERRQLPWYILSAAAGLVKPTSSTRPYDKTLKAMEAPERLDWAAGVFREFISELHEVYRAVPLQDVVVEVHAGELYCQPLIKLFDAVGIRCERPVAGLGIGEQLQWYTSQIALLSKAVKAVGGRRVGSNEL